MPRPRICTTFARSSKLARICSVADPFATVHAIVDRVVDDYGPVVGGIGNDVDQPTSVRQS
jgi:hypothetical protein